MQARIVTGDWRQLFKSNIGTFPTELRIICPFIKADALRDLLRANPKKIRVITRFDLNNFVDGVSDIESLKLLFEAGAQIGGIKGLHSKVYIFGDKRAVITSANLTKAGLEQNSECGTISDSADFVSDCIAYFEKLWKLSNTDRTEEDIDKWNREVNERRAATKEKKTTKLNDYGNSVPKTTKVNSRPHSSQQAFVKFYGSSKIRSGKSLPVLDHLDQSGAHWVGAYPSSKRPRAVKDGDIMFLGAFTEDPNDILVFGRAVAYAHDEERDNATEQNIKLRPWMEKYSRFIRFYNAEIIAGTIGNGVSLNELMDDLEANSFASTQKNRIKGEGNTNPLRAYNQQNQVKLSPEGHFWLNERLNIAFENHGTISDDELDALDWPDFFALGLSRQIGK